MRKLFTFLTLAMLFALTSTATVTDELDRSLTGVSSGSTSYKTWTGVSGTKSKAVYAGNSAGGNDAIQLRSSESNSGIVTTASGGKVKKITVVWQSSTASGRTLNVYGKSSAYSAASDLYSTDTQGTLLGTIVNGTSTTLTVSGDYEYIGLRSASGAMYLTSISIEWDDTSGSGSGSYYTKATTYQLVTSASDLVNKAEYILVYNTTPAVFGGISSTSSKYGLSKTGNTNLTISGNTITIPSGSEAVPLILEKVSSDWIFKLPDNSYLYYSGSSNTLSTYSSATGNATWSISIASNGNATITNYQVTTRYLRYNTNSGQERFACYTSSTTGTADPQLYKKVEQGSETEDDPEEPTATVTFSPAGGAVEAGTTVSLSLNGTASGIKYTVNGDDVTSSSATYSGPITINEATTIKARAYNYSNSKYALGAQTEASFTIAVPTTVEAEATFIFNTDAGLNALGITKPASGGDTKLGTNTYTSNDVTLSSTDGGTATRVWNSSGTTDLRVYSNGGTITLTVPTGCTITKIVIAGKDYGNFTASPDTYSSGTWTGNATSVKFTATGTVKINTITVTYTKPTAETELAVVTGIAAFKEVESGTTVRLYLPDANNARVLHVESNGTTTDAYIRDNTGSMLMKGISPNRPMAYNQHIAGWVNGQYSVDAETGLPLFVPDNDLTNTAFLVIADPVTEATTLPVEIAVSNMNDHLGDWATVKDVRVGDSGAPAITNKFGSQYTTPYSGALIDLNGIVASGTIYPMTESEEEPLVTYVVDAAKEFNLPSQAVTGVPIRWQRTLTAGVWTPVTVPFAISDFDGTIMQYTSLTKGQPVTGTESGRTFDAGNMNFTQVSTIEAGVPYLVKANDTFASMTIESATLTATEAGSLSFNGTGAVNAAPARAMSTADVYSMVGTYNAETVEASNANKLLVNGNVVWASKDNNTVEGTGAYFVTPTDQSLHLVLGDDNSPQVITGIATVIEAATAPRGTYNMLGMKMSDDWTQLPAGIYIVNGKKIVKQ